MLEYLQKLWAKYGAWRKGFVPFPKIVDEEAVKETLNHSPVTILQMLVLIWIVSSVLLGLSHEKLMNLDDWRDGRPMPYSLQVRKPFQTVDYSATETERERAKEKIPPHFRVDVRRSNQIQHNISSFFDAIVRRAESETAKTQFKVLNKQTDTAALSLYRAKEIAAKLTDPLLRKAVDDTAGQLLRHGIRGGSGVDPAIRKGEVIVVHSGGKTYTRAPEDGEQAARILANALELDRESQIGFLAVVPDFFENGNLLNDETATRAEREAAAAKIEPVMRRYASGSMLITEGELLTPELRERLKSYAGTLVTKDGVILFVCQIGISFAFLLSAMFLLFIVYRTYFSTAGDFTLGSFIIILSLFVNYVAIRLFFSLYAAGVLSEKIQLIYMLPVALGPALLSVFLGSRTAIFGGLLIAGVTSQMVPSFDTSRLLFHWLVIITLISLRLRSTNNYRTFFLHLFLGNLVLTMLVNTDYAFEMMPVTKVAESAACISCSALACAMIGLIVVFCFELIFNADTRMSLMVLCDFNHPLLEKLKREANGTLTHSLNVSILAEDGAKAIHANALRAKAGALFHDIGKLKRPAYFTENNPASSVEYEKMSPQRSCSIIRSHVTEGLELAKKNRLNHFIRRVIFTHHGDDHVSFFYRKALAEQKENGGEPVLEKQFRYKGEPPHTKEETIISLADACEAACRSIDDPTSKKIEEMVENIFIGRLRGKQLRESQLTLNELEIVKQCFIEDLGSLCHRRISYSQEEKKDDAAAPHVEVPESSGSPQK